MDLKWLKHLWRIQWIRGRITCVLDPWSDECICKICLIVSIIIRISICEHLFFFFNLTIQLSISKLYDLHMLWVITYAVNQLIWLELTDTDFINGREQGESALSWIKVDYNSSSGMQFETAGYIPVLHSFALKHVVDLFGGDRTLQFLTIQKLSF